jgi:hypothetical protein
VPHNAVPELEVLLASIHWLWARGAKPVRISIASGSDTGQHSDRSRLRSELQKAGIPLDYVSAREGADLVAASSSEVWQIECKGSGLGKVQTQRNNFDRALASVVTYYVDAASQIQPGSVGDPYLGLALPATSAYLRELRRRVRSDLRRRLNLWILLVSPGTPTVLPVSPKEEYPETR